MKQKWAIDMEELDKKHKNARADVRQLNNLLDEKNEKIVELELKVRQVSRELSRVE